MIHPWQKLIEEIRDRNWTQKQFAVLVWKKNSEVNELIKWKRNITIQWDLILSEILWTPEKYRINMQIDYDYEQMKIQRKKEMANQKPEFEVVEDISDDFVHISTNDRKDPSWANNLSSWMNAMSSWTNVKDIIKFSQPQIDKNETSRQEMTTDTIDYNTPFPLEKIKELKNIFLNF